MNMLYTAFFHTKVQFFDETNKKTRKENMVMEW